MRTRTFIIALAGVATLGIGPSMPVAAKDQPTVEARVDKLEHEMRAVQRKVFPGGDGKYFAPEITPPDQADGTAPGTPATPPVVDLEGRVNALEAQLSTLTGQVETTQHRLQLLEDGFSAYKRATDARLRALEGGAPATDAGTVSVPSTAAADTPRPVPAASTTPRPSLPSPTPPASNGVTDSARAKALAAVEKPVTTDPADDIYVYGFRLWNAKFYPEAETQLKLVVSKYPTHRRASWAQNLLGRAYLDEGRYKDAAQAFYDNYKKYPDGERTADSVYYLASALRKLNRPTEDVCKAYGVLINNYGTKLTATMSSDVAKQRADLKCS